MGGDAGVIGGLCAGLLRGFATTLADSAQIGARGLQPREQRLHSDGVLAGRE